MPTFRVRALVDGKMRRSWGESVDAEASRKEATAQLSKITDNFEIVSVEEIDSVKADAEDITAQLLGVDRINVPNKPVKKYS